MLRRLGTLTPRISEQSSLSISLSDYPEGTHAVGDIFFRKTSGNNVAFVISRICDHAGGKLILRNDLGCAVCPMHGWRLDLDTLNYLNVPEKKRMLPFEVKAGVLHVDLPEFLIELPSSGPCAGAVVVACLRGTGNRRRQDRHRPVVGRPGLRDRMVAELRSEG